MVVICGCDSDLEMDSKGDERKKGTKKEGGEDKIGGKQWGEGEERRRECVWEGWKGKCNGNAPSVR